MIFFYNIGTPHPECWVSPTPLRFSLYEWCRRLRLPRIHTYCISCNFCMKGIQRKSFYAAKYLWAINFNISCWQLTLKTVHRLVLSISKNYSPRKSILLSIQQYFLLLLLLLALYPNISDSICTGGSHPQTLNCSVMILRVSLSIFCCYCDDKFCTFSL